MKSKSIVGVLMVSFLILSSSKNITEQKIFNGIFDGHEEYGYNFIGINSEGDEYTMTFQEVDKAVLKTFDLNFDNLIGKKFTVGYTTKIQIEKDENGFEDESEIHTIITLNNQ
jgi:hypothetical protein